MLVVMVTISTKKFFADFCLVHSAMSYRMLKIGVNEDKIQYILQFLFDKGENAFYLFYCNR